MISELFNSEEKDIQRYLEEHDFILSAVVGEISWYYNFVLPHVHLGNEDIPDFIVINGQSDSFYVHMVDLKLPRAKRFNQDDSFCGELCRAIGQVQKYMLWGENHVEYLKEILCKEILSKYSNKLEPSVIESLKANNFFSSLRRFRIFSDVIIGRKSDLTALAAWQTSNLKDSGVCIISYDRLAAAENRITEMINHHIDKSLYSSDDSVISEYYSGYGMKNGIPDSDPLFSTDLGSELLIKTLRDILDRISFTLLNQGKSIIVADEGDEFRWFVEILSLMAKQVNLCGACLTLLENQMEQEAYLLARSQFNNMLWIKYLINDEDGKHMKEFIAQPYISQLFTNDKLKESLEHLDEGFKKKLEESLGKPPVQALNESSDRFKTELNSLGITDRKLKSIFRLAQEAPELFDMYITFYNEGSKYEHSDISTTKMYRKAILPEYDNEHVFSFSLNTHNDDVWKRVLSYSNMCLFYSFDAIRKRIVEKERHLIDGDGNIAGAYDENLLKTIDKEFCRLQKMLDWGIKGSENKS